MSKNYRYQVYKFSELSTALLYDILALRSKVFVVEQNIIYQDIDGLDTSCIHLCLFDGDNLIGCARITPPGLKFPEASIGRIIIDKDYRRQNFGIDIIKQAINTLNELYSDDSHIIEAQEPLKSFYESVGYICMTEPYMLEGLMHIKMSYSPQGRVQTEKLSYAVE